MVVLLGSGCGRESRNASSANAQISLTAIPFPAAVGAVALGDPGLQISAGQPISDAALSIKGDMTHAGMVPVLAEVQGGDAEGYYQVPIEWTMAGDWVVTVEVTLANGTSAQKRFESLCSHRRRSCVHG